MPIREDMFVADSLEPSVQVGGPSLVVDDEYLRFSLDENSVLDVLFDGQRVWSISATDFKRDCDGYRHAPWPDRIRPRLEGETLLEMRDHLTGRVVAATEATFGSGEGRATIVDEMGRPVALTKHGRFNRPFESIDRAAIDGYLDQVEEVVTVLRDECALPAFISFGTLLGAVRTGQLIGHDVDVDLGYLSAYDNPVDVIRESLRVERVLRRKGWRVVRQNGGFLALFMRQADGSSRNLDVFSCFVVNGMLYQVHDVRTKAGRSAVLPLQDIELEGRLLPAPAKPQVFLKAAYGRSWRVPDPSFEYHTPRATKRRINGWLGGLRARRDNWSAFYSANGEGLSPEPSDFARWMATRESPRRLLDLGCGTGRDSLFFAGQGFKVTGLDFVPTALNRAQRKARDQRVSVDLMTVNLYSVRESLVAGAILSKGRGQKLVCARHLLDDLRPHGRDNFWRLTRSVLRNGGRCYLEFRIPADSAQAEIPGPPGQRVIDPDELAAEAVAKGAIIVHREEGSDGTHAADEYPHNCRLVLEW